MDYTQTRQELLCIVEKRQLISFMPKELQHRGLQLVQLQISYYRVIFGVLMGDKSVYVPFQLQSAEPSLVSVARLKTSFQAFSVSPVESMLPAVPMVTAAINTNDWYSHHTAY